MTTVFKQSYKELSSYTATQLYLVNINLSSNNLRRSVPDELTRLPGLLGLNLSNNQFTGTIPNDIWRLTPMVSVNLSRNKLWGTIPGSMAYLYSLGHLNLSQNDFSGPIPTGNQLQTLNDPSIYSRNPYLCGILCPRNAWKLMRSKKGRKMMVTKMETTGMRTCGSTWLWC